MKNAVATSVFFAALFLLSGCSGGHDSVMKQRSECWNEAADIVESIKDDKSADAARPKLKRIYDRLQELKKKSQSLGDLPKDKETELAKKHKLDQAVQRYDEAQRNAILRRIPGAAEVMFEFETGQFRN